MGTHRMRPLGAALAAAALFAALSPAAAQQGTATLEVTVTAAATGEPLPGARVRLEGSGAAGVTDAAGAVRLAGVPAGAHMVRVSLLGYEVFRSPTALEGGAARVLRVALTVDAVALEPLEATGTRMDWADRMLEGRGFYERKRGSPGVFMTRDDLLRQNTRSLNQLLSRHARLNVAYDSYSQTQPRAAARRAAARGGATRCQPTYWVDGVQLTNFDPSTLRPENIEGIEIYRGASEVPAVFNRGTAACGCVVIWTRVN